MQSGSGHGHVIPPGADVCGLPICYLLFVITIPRQPNGVSVAASMNDVVIERAL
jgi:hypothetical protein